MRLMRMQDLAEREVEAWPSPTVPQPLCPPSAVAQPLCPPTVPQPGPLVRVPNPLALGSGLGERTPKKVGFQL